jgi:hypothetical protein
MEPKDLLIGTAVLGAITVALALNHIKQVIYSHEQRGPVPPVTQSAARPSVCPSVYLSVY